MCFFLGRILAFFFLHLNSNPVTVFLSKTGLGLTWAPNDNNYELLYVSLRNFFPPSGGDSICQEVCAAACRAAKAFRVAAAKWARGEPEARPPCRVAL